MEWRIRLHPSAFILSSEPLVRLAEQLDIVERGDADAAGEQAIADGDRSVVEALGLNQDHGRRLAHAFFADDRARGKIELYRLAADRECRAAEVHVIVGGGTAFS